VALAYAATRDAPAASTAATRNDKLTQAPSSLNLSTLDLSSLDLSTLDLSSLDLSSLDLSTLDLSSTLTFRSFIEWSTLRTYKPKHVEAD
jgi:uncharacterized protein YjbI with pentapeptide repeats